MGYRVFKRGVISKREVDGQLILERNLLIKRFQLALTRDKCIGCGICSDVCPKEAIKYFPAEFKGNKAVTRPSIDFEPEKCTLCGECVVTCPMNALRMTIEGKEMVPVIGANVFATLTEKW